MDAYNVAHPGAEAPSRLAAAHRTTCPACGQHFSGDTAFDAHRVGSPTEKPPHFGRRCRSPAEFANLGYVVKGGVWHHAQPEERPAHWRGNAVSGHPPAPTSPAPA